MKKAYLKKFVSAVVILALIIVFSNFSAAFAQQMEANKIISSKLSPSLKEELKENNGETIPVLIHASNDVNPEEILQKTLSNTRLNFNNKMSPLTDISMLETYAQADEIQNFIESKRKISRQYYSEFNNEFIKNNVPNGAEVEYISQYSPVIFASVKKDAINSIALKSQVGYLTYDDTIAVPNADHTNISVPAIQADYVRDTFGNKGAGVKIGQLESGVPQNSATYFNTNKLHILTESTTTATTEHATQVAAIMVGKAAGSYKGIASDAELYSFGVGNSLNAQNEIRGVESLLSKGVNIVNISRTISVESITDYDFMSQWLDHISTTHDVHVVLSAGNTGINSLAGGRYSHNAIVVGASDDRGTVSITDDIIADYSSCSTSTYLPNKPDLSAPGNNITAAGYTRNGTSFSAPHVTGVIAQLCSYKPALKTQQTAIKALLIAGVHNTDANHLFNLISNPTKYRQWGAGIVDARGTRWVISQNRYVSSSFLPSQAVGATKTYTFQVTAADSRIRVALCLMRKNLVSGSGHGTVSTVAIAGDLDLKVVGPSGTFVANSTYNNTEIIDIPSPKPGTYTITVSLFKNSNQNIPFGLAWR